MSSTVTLKNAIETIENLNKTDQSMTDTINLPGASDGLYVMINKMISDLAAIKIAVKSEERKIQKELTAKVIEGGDSLAIDASTANLLDANITVATLKLTSGTGSVDGDRHENNISGSNTLPAVYSANSNNYSEDCVFGILARAAEIIRTLKNGDYTTTVTAAGPTTVAV